MEDSAAIRATLDALYAWISGPAGRREPAALEALFVEGGRLVPTRPVGDGCRFTALGPGEFAAKVNAALEERPFYESQAEVRILVFGNLAHAWSQYDGRDAKDAPPVARGVNSVQLLKVDGAWKVLSVAWDVERPDNRLPSRYPP